jgi:hypothetical protein
VAGANRRSHRQLARSASQPTMAHPVELTSPTFNHTHDQQGLKNQFEIHGSFGRQYETFLRSQPA